MRLSGFALIASLLASVAIAPSSSASSVPPPGPDVHGVGQAAQSAARSFWTPAAMTAATAASAVRQELRLGPLYGVGSLPSLISQSPPRGIPGSTSFSGVPTVGALFYTSGSGRHFCTASVVASTTGTIVLTAAHCVYSGRYSANLVFVPGYEDGSAPYGAWAVRQITVARGWRQRQDPSLDYAFLDVVPPPASVGPIQVVTGALTLGFRLHDKQSITVIGYNDSDQRPIRCATKSFKFSNSQMEFYCRGFWYGTSGGPWIIGFHGGSGSGTVFGVIGGYEAGGDQSWASYSTILWQGAQALFRQAETAAAGSA